MNNLPNALRKHQGPIAFLLITALLAAVLIGIRNNFERRQDALLQSALDDLDTKVETSLSTYERFADYLFHSLILEEGVPEAMWRAGQGDARTADAIRRQLLARLMPRYRTLELYDYRQLHLHNARGESFLRFHQPDKYGDPLADVRETIRYVSKEHRPVHAFEEGRIYNGYRFIHPLFHQEEYVGSVEISISAGAIIEILGRAYPDLSMRFLIDEEAVQNTVWEDEQTRYAPHPDFPGYRMDMVVEQISRESGRPLEADTLSGLAEKLRARAGGTLARGAPLSIFVREGDEDYLVRFLPVRNLTEQPVAYLVAISESDQARALQKTWLFNAAIVFLLYFLVLHATLSSLRRQRIMERLAKRDELTGLYNRRAFLERSERAGKKRLAQAVVVMGDIDHFKEINDRLGHAAGDDVLQDIADTLLSAVRDGDILARWGGEEFIALLPDTSREQGVAVAERMRAAVERAPGPVTMSFGVALQRGLDDLDAAIARADRAMYRAKDDGRNRVRAAQEETAS